MVQYRRDCVPGGSFIFTVTLRDRRSRLLTEHIDQLRQAYRGIQRASPFVREASVAWVKRRRNPGLPTIITALTDSGLSPYIQATVMDEAWRNPG